MDVVYAVVLGLDVKIPGSGIAGRAVTRVEAYGGNVESRDICKVVSREDNVAMILSDLETLCPRIARKGCFNLNWSCWRACVVVQWS